MENKSLKYWLPWIWVLPGAVLTGILSTFLLHWILYSTLVHGEMIWGMDIKPIEYAPQYDQDIEKLSINSRGAFSLA